MNRFLKILILVFLIQINLCVSVLGIDFGSEYFKASIISPGKTFAIIENETSKRKTHNAVIINR